MQRQQLAQQGLAGMVALMDGLLEPGELARSASGTGSRRRVFDTAPRLCAARQLLAGHAACRAAPPRIHCSPNHAPK